MHVLRALTPRSESGHSQFLSESSSIYKHEAKTSTALLRTLLLLPRPLGRSKKQYPQIVRYTTIGSFLASKRSILDPRPDNDTPYESSSYQNVPEGMNESQPLWPLLGWV